MILTRDGKEVIAIYKQNGDEVDEVKDANGRLVYTNTREITGTLPLSFTSRGKPLTDYIISGNTVQDGTPTPEAPVDVVGCGVRTGNLFDGNYANAYVTAEGIYRYPDTTTKSIIVKCSPNTSYTIRQITGISAAHKWRIAVFNSMPTDNVRGTVLVNDDSLSESTITTANDSAYIVVYYVYTSLPQNARFMVNTGSTALPYEPYGYKLPPTVNSTESLIYLGEAQTTRRIKKLVLTGEERWAVHTGIENWYYVDNIFSPIANTSAYCDRYKFASYSSAEELTNGKFTFGNPAGITSICRLIFKDTAQATVTDFKTYLQQQYAAGTPVTVWYVLAAPETGIINEPLMKIGDYTDTISFAQAGVTIPTIHGTNVLDMSSPVKPSEVYIKGKGIKAIT